MTKATFFNIVSFFNWKNLKSEIWIIISLVLEPSVHCMEIFDLRFKIHRHSVWKYHWVFHNLENFKHNIMDRQSNIYIYEERFHINIKSAITSCKSWLEKIWLALRKLTASLHSSDWFHAQGLRILIRS